MSSAVTPKITPFLWYNGRAEEAAKLYTSVFRKSKIVRRVKFGVAGPGPKLAQGQIRRIMANCSGQSQ
jgi:predicted 3-demethylubiquinone-9 3-methyltransferase (glyoxalase superfamily)